MRPKQTIGKRILKRKRSLEKTGEWVFYREGYSSEWIRNRTVNNPNFFKISVDPFLDRLF